MTTRPSEAELLESLERVQGSLGLEGMALKPEEQQLLLRTARGEITHEEYVHLVVDLALRSAPGSR